jgi:coenzyme F420-reducing hydrogenase beta subunit
MESYEELESRVILSGKCTVCGACVSACPLYYIKFIDGILKRPKKKAACRECGVCFNACYLTSNGYISSKGIGSFIKVVSARMISDPERDSCQDGGVVTAVLGYALNEGLIDGALVTGQDGWKPLPVVIKNREELILHARVKFGESPLLAKIRHAIIEENLSRIGLVGLPCHIQSVRNLEVRNIEPLCSVIALKISLFCTRNLEYSSIEKEVMRLGIKMEEIQKFTVKEGFFNIHIPEKIVKIHLNKTHSWVPAYCPCSDYSGDFADISVGSGYFQGSSTVIIRTEKGERIMHALEKSGILITCPIEDISFLVEASEKKRAVGVRSERHKK